jgi:hypothetical protein
MGRNSESAVVESLMIECLKIYGFETYYLPRSEVNRDVIFTEDPPSKFQHSFNIEMYLQNTNGYDGERDLLSKFGVQIKDTATFLVARRRWEELIGRTKTSLLTARPAEGDIVFLPLTNSFFEIKRVETLDPFFQVGKLYTFKLECELFNYSSEEFITGNNEIDDIINVKSLDMMSYQMLLEDGTRFLMESANNDSALLQETYDIETIDIQSQNDTFTKTINDVLDFSESNPFGEVR